MRSAQMRGGARALLVLACGLSLGGVRLAAEEPVTPPVALDEPPWIELLPAPFDPELEAILEEVQDALRTIHQQMVRRKEGLDRAQDPAARTVLYEELDALRKERDELQSLLHHLVEEAKISERTAIDDALAHARWLERQQEYQAQQEELLRDRQE